MDIVRAPMVRPIHDQANNEENIHTDSVEAVGAVSRRSVNLLDSPGSNAMWLWLQSWESDLVQHIDR
jgi:hypothetical protein